MTDEHMARQMRYKISSYMLPRLEQ